MLETTPVAKTGLRYLHWRKIVDTGSCWLWTGSLTDRGYGKTTINGRQTYVHRAVYEDQVGLIPDGLMLDHTCHVRHCCNPDHLRLADRVLNGQNRRGASSHSKSGVRGVYRQKGKWRVQAKGSDGRHHSGGMFDSLEDAEAAAIALRARVMVTP